MSSMTLSSIRSPALRCVSTRNLQILPLGSTGFTRLPLMVTSCVAWPVKTPCEYVPAGVPRRSLLTNCQGPSKNSIGPPKRMLPAIMPPLAFVSLIRRTASVHFEGSAGAGLSRSSRVMTRPAL